MASLERWEQRQEDPKRGTSYGFLYSPPAAEV